MNWFKKHINLTWTIFFLLQFAFVTLDSLTPFIVARVIWIVATFWALHQKGRSLVWVLIPIAVIFLHNNKGDDSKELLNELRDNWVSEEEKLDIREELIKRGSSF